MPCIGPTPEEALQMELINLRDKIEKPDQNSAKYLADRNQWLEAALCMVTTTLEKVYSDFNKNNPNAIFHHSSVLDYKEAGISRKSFMNWWKDHKAKDLLRREQEKKVLEEKEARDSAVQKLKASLTEEELRLLNISL